NGGEEEVGDQVEDAVLAGGVGVVDRVGVKGLVAVDLGGAVQAEEPALGRVVAAGGQVLGAGDRAGVGAVVTERVDRRGRGRAAAGRGQRGGRRDAVVAVGVAGGDLAARVDQGLHRAVLVDEVVAGA